eukprot:GHVN01002847.1.p2 GENE.GHVN01002847.1~~GHVN01002847.1.p2  ORF type:complete len:350 (-),score=40.74 GHVN01002847.1:2224-3273(-)
MKTKRYGRRNTSSLPKRFAFEKTLHRDEYELLLRHSEKIKPFASVLDDLDLNEENVNKKTDSTYADVFYVSRHQCIDILKIVRLEGEDDDLSFTPMPLTREEFLHEAEISLAVSGKKGFVLTKKILLYKGGYPELLLRKWEAFGSKENAHPSKYTAAGQIFAVFVFEDAGCELEAFSFADEEEAKTLFVSLAESLLEAESMCFEHRDMHVSNILVKRAHGNIQCSLIDFMFSGIFLRETFVYRDLSQMYFLFEGTETHHEIYKKMKAANNNCWNEYNPATNIFWLIYLAEWLEDRAKTKSLKAFFKKASSFLEQTSTIEEFWKMWKMEKENKPETLMPGHSKQTPSLGL